MSPNCSPEAHSPDNDCPENHCPQGWCVYIILSSDNRLYTGITNNMVKRWHAHHGKQGAKFFRGRLPSRLLYLEPQEDRAEASRREAEIKKLTRPQKLRLIEPQADIDWHRKLNL
ncbi:GIY-YIG nuclease family protein [Pseudomaricurvus alkylphenolicus]|uniref:GIY-YIG nuclease family protein n=1 Tax=Pseudomaricurvus alkylphenolicus TaxID=1306991 RepID=UPI001F0FA9A7|nr:GIY-YIG nuclease family protein [Pseudomaricurvus alkylphenolicus]